MKNLTALLFMTCLLVVSGSINAQTWTPLTSGITTSILSVSVVDLNTAYVCGAGGKILKTTNGGTTWISQTSGTVQDLYSIDFTDANNGVAVGNSGTVRRTVDGGTTWTGVTFTSDALRRVSFFDASTGFIVGGVSTSYGSIFKTTNGGATWTSLTVASTNGMYGIKFVSATEGYACDFTGAIFKTTNGGTTWTSLPSGTTSVLYAIDFPTATSGVVAGTPGIVRRTTTAGAAWSPVSSGTTDALTDLKFADALSGVAVGGNISANTGIILTTNNGGASWGIYTPGTSRLYGCDFLNVNFGYAVGLDGTILKYSSNVGITEQGAAVPLLTAYPNPASGAFTLDLSGIKFGGDVVVELFDVSGKLIRRTSFVPSATVVIDRGDLSPGVYFINVIDGAAVAGTAKVIVE